MWELDASLTWINRNSSKWCLLPWSGTFLLYVFFSKVRKRMFSSAKLETGKGCFTQNRFGFFDALMGYQFYFFSCNPFLVQQIKMDCIKVILHPQRVHIFWSICLFIGFLRNYISFCESESSLRTKWFETFLRESRSLPNTHIVSPYSRSSLKNLATT